MENEDELYHNLVTLLKLFKNRPYHLAKYLLENSALSKEFSKNILKSDKLKDLQDKMETEGINIDTPIHFPDITKMKEYYNSLSQFSESIEELTKELNQKMNELIKEEKYEEAARLRDYMINKKIKRKK